MQIFKDTIGIIRDLAIILFIGAMFLVGFRAVAALNELGNDLKQTPVVTTPSLPQDNCGGGICGEGE